MAGGDFSQEAYQALREAYANELVTQEEAEIQGVSVMGQSLSTETIPVDSPWLDKVGLEQYPTGKSAYADGPQRTPEEVLEIMRASVAKREADEGEAEEKETEEESMSDEEVDNLIESILDDEDDNDTEETEDGDSEEDDDGEDEESEAEETEPSASTETSEDDEEEDDGEEGGSSEEGDGPEDEESGSGDVDELSPDDIAAEIEALRAELDSLSFRPEEPQDDE
tara:strand:+ start:43 stop:717 length:675 start_codon:yes stop_codon:yes gene_type:complete